jgi:hypothetical protein
LATSTAVEPAVSWLSISDVTDADFTIVANNGGGSGGSHTLTLSVDLSRLSAGAYSAILQLRFVSIF